MAIIWIEKCLTLALFGWNIFIFTRAIIHGFSRPQGVPLLMRLMGACGALAALVDSILITNIGKLPMLQIIGAGILLTTSQMLFRSSLRVTKNQRLSLAFSNDTPDHLQRKGPYWLVRHPFYSAYILTWAGAAIATMQITSLLILLGMSVFYFCAATKEEQKFLLSKLAADYRAYRRSTGMFFPKISI